MVFVQLYHSLYSVSCVLLLSLPLILSQVDRDFSGAIFFFALRRGARLLSWSRLCLPLHPPLLLPSLLSAFPLCPCLLSARVPLAARPAPSRTKPTSRSDEARRHTSGTNATKPERCTRRHSQSAHWIPHGPLTMRRRSLGSALCMRCCARHVPTENQAQSRQEGARQGECHEHELRD